MSAVIALLVIAACAAINRLRGGGLGAAYLPGHPRLYASVLIGAVAWLIHGSALTAAFAGLGYYIWSLPPWGRWYTLNRMSRAISGAPSPAECVIEDLCDGDTRHDHLAFALRMCAAWPLIIALAFCRSEPLMLFWLPLFPLLATAAYEAGWRSYEAGRVDYPTMFAEWIVGGLFGLMLVL